MTPEPTKTGLTFFNKLVRDKIPQIVSINGDRAAFRQLNEIEFHLELKRKLAEEVAEYLKDGSVEELADVLEVVVTLAEELHGGYSELQDAVNIKASDRGSFRDRIYMMYGEFRSQK